MDVSGGKQASLHCSTPAPLCQILPSICGWHDVNSARQEAQSKVDQCDNQLYRFCVRSIPVGEPALPCSGRPVAERSDEQHKQAHELEHVLDKFGAAG